MRSVTYLMVCSLPSSGYPFFSAPQACAASPGLHPARHRDFTPNSTNCGYGYVRIYTESLSSTNTNIVHLTQQIAGMERYGYIRRVCYIPAQELYTRRNKLRVRSCTDIYGEFVIYQHQYCSPNATNYKSGRKTDRVGM